MLVFPLRLLFVSVILILVQQKVNSASDNYVTKANNFMDDLIQEIKSDKTSVYSLDPLTVPDVDEHNFKTTDLTIHGLSKLHREDDCSVELTLNGTVLVTCKLSANDLLVSFDYSAKALFIWFSGEGEFKVDRFQMELKTSFHFQTTTLENLTILKLGAFHMQKMNGLSFMLNWMLKLIADRLFNSSIGKISTALSETATESLKNILKKKIRRLSK